ncbi:TetR/AcrR family transcriptional regulator [Nocardia sp. BSTN01]|uniref:TetR/AcrR family transcriptional regulator n=1 Tax=Nocardia sp. BSTN01 TaxID=2783665 RepID=UPI00188F27F8|nr:TetR/AcrR family transcriptional regulator [Nocardia sp. BSTN01]MBF4996801.1 TetR/AcrR family transcriptional regulator [Nocardia sp. BSTN01]
MSENPPSTPRRDDSGTGPVGREAVVAAVTEAAADLFAERGPAATSIRDIADRAGVNHGLVFRHLGAKDKLVGAVLSYLGEQSGALAAAGQLTATDPRLRRHLTVLARCILDGYPVGELQEQFPVMAMLIENLRPRMDSDRAAGLAVAHLAAFAMGWQLLEPFLRSAAGLRELTDAELRASIEAQAARILRPDPTSS